MPCHSYIFFDSLPSLATVSKHDFDEYKTAFFAILESVPEVTVASYATTGFKQGSYFMLHFSAQEAESIQRCIQLFMQTELGGHLAITYALWGLIRPSQYRTQGPKEEKPFVDGAMK